MRKVDGIKVLMMGARRAGKTSVLAGLVDTILSPDINKYIQVTDKSDSVTSEILKKKKETLINILKDNVGNTILVEEGITHNFNDYVLNVSLPGGGGDTNLIFTDANGEYYANGSSMTEEIKKKIKEYDVIVIAIDTPYLMESSNTENHECTESINRAYNQIGSVHTLLCELDDAEGQDAKLVLFVPIKCEYWAKKGMLKDVCNRVEECYEASICALSSFPMIEVAIVPVQTVGNIVFDSHRKAMVLNTSTKNDIKCSELSHGNLLLSGGETYKLLPQDKLNDDYSAVIEGFKIRRPNSWFTVVSDKYEPKDCEQLAYFILHYMLCKTLSAKKREEKKDDNGISWWKIALVTAAALTGHIWLAAGIMAFSYLSKKMGTINLEVLQNTINVIKKEGLWKLTTDDIRVINKAYL